MFVNVRFLRGYFGGSISCLQKYFSFHFYYITKLAWGTVNTQLSTGEN